MAYSLARRSGALRTSLGRRLFKSAYFLYKRYIEDDLRELIEALPGLVGEGDVLDIGANIGYTASVLARAAKPGHKVYAFEPEPFNFRLLQETSEQSGFDGKIVPVQCAVGAENGTVDLWINLSHHADHRVATEQFRSAHPAAKQASVSLVSVDNFLASRPGSVSFVKIDVQGYELAVCQGMQDMLQQNPDISVVLEYMPSAMRDLGFEPSHLIDFFAERGFRVYQVHSRGKLTPGMPTVVEDSNYFDLLFSRRPIVCGCEI
ncbi:MAG: FkbM family methyltransferase [Terracidiphilus sp.]